MNLEPGRARTTSGLSVLWDVLVAPKAAFAALRERPYIGWAYAIAAALSALGAFLVIPAGQHIAVATFAAGSHDPAMASLTPEQQKNALNVALVAQRWIWLFTPVTTAFGIALAALVMLVGNAISRGDGTFRRFFSLAANVAIVSFGIRQIVLGALVLARGADGFSTQRDIITVVPSLAWLAPGASNKLATVLAAFDPFQLWSLVLLALGMQIVAHVKPPVAWTVATLLTVGAVMFAVPFGK
jgi:hypothetical protein